MNAAIASVYAISITHEGGRLSQEQKDKIVDRVPLLIEEIQRLERIAHDPFVQGYLKAKESGTTFSVTVEAPHER